MRMNKIVQSCDKKSKLLLLELVFVGFYLSKQLYQCIIDNNFINFFQMKKEISFLLIKILQTKKIAINYLKNKMSKFIFGLLLI